MWENRCKVAVSGVGFSKVRRSAKMPLAAHARTAVKEAIAASGLQMSDIDGLATYPELPATGHADVDGIPIVSVNCMIATLKRPNLSRHIEVGTVNIGGAVQQAVNALLAGCANTRWCDGQCTTRAAPTRTSPARSPRALRSSLPRNAAPPHAAQSSRLFLRHAADARGLPQLPDGGVSVLSLRLRHSGAGGGRDCLDDSRAGTRPEAKNRPTSPATGNDCISK